MGQTRTEPQRTVGEFETYPRGAKLGFTGPRSGMSLDQLRSARLVIVEEIQPLEFHHGDCGGSDKEAFDIVHFGLPKCITFAHPPIDPKWRAFTESDVILEERDYLSRDRDIVDSTCCLVSTPRQDPDHIPPQGARGEGTWYTINYAVRKRKVVYIIWPDGTIVRWN